MSIDRVGIHPLVPKAHPCYLAHMVVVHPLHASESAHRVVLLDTDVSAQQLVLVGHLSQQFFVEFDLLHQADDRLLILVLRKSTKLQHLLLLFALQVALKTALVHHLFWYGVAQHAFVKTIIVALD